MNFGLYRSRSGYTWTYYQNTVQLLIASGVIDQQLECSLPLYNYGIVSSVSLVSRRQFVKCAEIVLLAESVFVHIHGMVSTRVLNPYIV